MLAVADGARKVMPAVVDGAWEDDATPLRRGKWG